MKLKTSQPCCVTCVKLLVLFQFVAALQIRFDPSPLNILIRTIQWVKKQKQKKLLNFREIICIFILFKLNYYVFFLILYNLFFWFYLVYIQSQSKKGPHPLQHTLIKTQLILWDQALVFSFHFFF